MAQTNETKNPYQVAGGLKAAINNPNVPEQSKQDAKERLNNMDVEETAPSQRSSKPADGETISGNVAGGYKATLNNPNVSEEAKDNARHILDNTSQEYRTK